MSSGPPALLLAPCDSLSFEQINHLRRLEVEPWQKAACGSIEAALEWSSSAPGGAVSAWALLVEGWPAAFLLLLRAPCAPPWAAPGSAVVQSFQVDRRAQRRGLGSACLKALSAAVTERWPDVSQLALGVDPGNAAALAFYRALGWAEAGRACRARVGYERQFVLPL